MSVLNGVKNTINACLDGFGDKIDGGLGDHAQGSMELFGIQTEVNRQVLPANEIFSLGEGAENGLQYGGVVMVFLNDAFEAIKLAAQLPTGRG